MTLGRTQQPQYGMQTKENKNPMSNASMKSVAYKAWIFLLIGGVSVGE
jgi:hypothetical protein